MMSIVLFIALIVSVVYHWPLWAIILLAVALVGAIAAELEAAA
jgi:hypothetical protein